MHFHVNHTKLLRILNHVNIHFHCMVWQAFSFSIQGWWYIKTLPLCTAHCTLPEEYQEVLLSYPFVENFLQLTSLSCKTITEPFLLRNTQSSVVTVSQHARNVFQESIFSRENKH